MTTGHHGRPPDRIDELDNFLPEDKVAARDFLLEIKALCPLIERFPHSGIMTRALNF